jgi:Ca2+-binding EF-hand superfamily protein
MFDVDAGNTIDKMELRKGLALIGMNVLSDDIDKLFADLDKVGP